MKLEKEKSEKERLERERIQLELAEKVKLAEKARLEKEKEKKDIEELKSSVTSSVIEAINKNIEALREQMVNKAISETSKAIEKSIVQKGCEKKNETVHRGYSCNLCGVYPIIGNRYRCTTCYDYDLCDVCETKAGDSHAHPLIKFRSSAIVPVIRPVRNMPENCNPFKKFHGNNKFWQFNNNNNNQIYENVCKELKVSFDLSKFRDMDIIAALAKFNGDVDKALESLFN